MIAGVGGQIDEAVAAQCQALADAGAAAVAIGAVDVLPPQDVGLAAVGIGFEQDVDDAGDRIRAVLRGGAVAQHLDVIHRRDRDQAHVHRHRTAPDDAGDVDAGGAMAALAVDQHQGVIRIEPAQAAGGDHIRGAVAGFGRCIERGHQIVERRQQARAPGLSSSAAPITSIGVGLSVTVRCTPRAPVTTTAARLPTAASAAAPRRVRPLVHSPRRVGRARRPSSAAPRPG